MFPSLKKINKTLHSFSGEDFHIIQQINHPKINRNFNVIGLAVAIICVGCLLSSGIFMLNVLQGAGKIWSIPVGIFWGFTVTNIYILLLYTISPPLLFDKAMLRMGGNGQKNKVFVANTRRFLGWLSISMIFRICFILVFALIIAQPLNVLFFGHKIGNDIEAYKMKFKADMILTSDSMRIADERKTFNEFHNSVKLKNLSAQDSLQLAKQTHYIDNKTLNDINYLKSATALNAELRKIQNKFDRKSELQKQALLRDLGTVTDNEVESDRHYLENTANATFSDSAMQKLFDEYAGNIKRLIAEKNEINQNTQEILDNNNFYIRQIVLVNKKVDGAKIVNAISVLVFLLPIYLKFQVRKIRMKNNASFYTVKEEYERKKVTESYAFFKENFKAILSEKYESYRSRAWQTLSSDLEKLSKVKPKTANEIRNDIEEHFVYQPGFYEKYLDPPFNLKAKTKNIYERSENDFLNEIYKDENGWFG